jgi:hypothetical protein
MVVVYEYEMAPGPIGSEIVKKMVYGGIITESMA